MVEEVSFKSMRQAESEISQLQIGRTQIKREQYLGTCNIVWGSKGSLTHHSEGYLGLSAAVEGSLFEIWSWSSSPSNDDMTREMDRLRR